MAIPIPSAAVKKTMPRNLERSSSSARCRGLLKNQLELVQVQLEGQTRYSIKPIEDKLTFDKGFYVFIRAVQLLVSKNPGVVVVGLAGPSGAGKTVFSQKVQSFIPGCTILSLDNYNDAARLIDGNFDDPRLTDYDLLLENIKALKAGRAAEVPIYDFRQSKRVGHRTVTVPSSRIVVVEGIYALSSRIRGLLDLGVSINGGVHFDLVKRVLRDIDRSGQPPAEIIQQISDTVYPMYKAFIEPDLKKAHLRIYNTFNPFSGFMNATYILKSTKNTSPSAVREALPGAKEDVDIETYDIYLLPPNEDPETCASWLRMRNRDGRYQLFFEEWVVEGDFIITPRISFEVSVRILGGLMALGYEIGSIMKRTSTLFHEGGVAVKLDKIEGMAQRFVQVQGKERENVAEIGRKLGLDGTYVPRSYIEQIQLQKLTSSFQSVTEDMKRRFAVAGEPLIEEAGLGGKSPRLGSFYRQTDFVIPTRPTLASSAPMTRSGSGQAGLLSQQIRPLNAGLQSGNSSHANGSDLLRDSSEGARPRPPAAGLSIPTSRPSSVADVESVPDDATNSSQPGMRSTRAEKLEQLLEGMSDRVDTLSLVPDMATSRLETQLQEVLRQQQAIVSRLQMLEPQLEPIASTSREEARSLWPLAASAGIGASVGLAVGLSTFLCFKGR